VAELVSIKLSEQSCSPPTDWTPSKSLLVQVTGGIQIAPPFRSLSKIHKSRLRASLTLPDLSDNQALTWILNVYRFEPLGKLPSYPLLDLWLSRYLSVDKCASHRQQC